MMRRFCDLQDSNHFKRRKVPRSVTEAFGLAVKLVSGADGL